MFPIFARTSFDLCGEWLADARVDPEGAGRCNLCSELAREKRGQDRSILIISYLSLTLHPIYKNSPR